MIPGFDPILPFVLLDDARPGGGARLLTGLRGAIVARAEHEVRPAFDALRSATRSLAGFIGYEAGYALEPRLAGRARPGGDELPLLWFGAFEADRRVAAGDVLAVAAGRRASVGAAEPRIDAPAHAAAVERALALIAAGDVYQVNLTFPAEVAVAGHPLALYAMLRGRGAAPWSALIHTGDSWVLSFSPELFFTVKGGALTARPMKGTAPAASDPAALAADPKNRAENLMIVDLLRNDLARVAEPGSVAVERLFAVESYPTVHQLTSTVRATARRGVAAADVLAAIFPCGSVTGAPKIRAMEVIGDLEPVARGLYTGAIGVIEPAGDAAFSVAIRTLVPRGGTARLGLGAGIVADSEAAAEWAECRDKAAFLTAPAPGAALIETLRFAPGEGLARLDRHLARLAEAAAALGYRCDLDAARQRLAAAVRGRTTALRARLLLGPDGEAVVQLGPPPASPSDPVAVTLVPLPVDPGDRRLRRKTSDRAFYDEARRVAGTFEVVFVRPDGRLTEGSFTNVFVKRDGALVTPPAADGLLPGVLRSELLDAGRAREATLTVADLAGGFWIGNSLRGLIAARLA